MPKPIKWFIELSANLQLDQGALWSHWVILTHWLSIGTSQKLK